MTGASIMNAGAAAGQLYDDWRQKQFERQLFEFYNSDKWNVCRKCFVAIDKKDNYCRVCGAKINPEDK